VAPGSKTTPLRFTRMARSGHNVAALSAPRTTPCGNGSHHPPAPGSPQCPMHAQVPTRSPAPYWPYTARTATAEEASAFAAVEGLCTRDDTYDEAECVVGGRYVLMHILGKGAQGVVYKAADLGTPGWPHVAIKSQQKNTSPGWVTEVNIMNSLAKKECPHTVHLLGHVEETKAVWYVMPLAGAPLYKCDGKSGAHTKQFTLSDIRRFGKPIAEALAAMHASGVVHRDIKGENVMLGPDGDSVFVADFGASATVADLESHQPNPSHPVVGTLAYIAPEVITRRAYGPPCDNWALGVLLLALLLGRLPFWPGEDAMFHDEELLDDIKNQEAPIPPGTDENLGELLRGLLAKDPTVRTTAADACAHPFFTAEI
jgi:serine/threonine protein kinase